VADHQQPEPDTEAEQNESIFVIRVVRVCNQPRVLVKKGGPRLLKRYSVLPLIGTILFFVPFEQIAAIRIV
jgi:hypothetical protein